MNPLKLANPVAVTKGAFGLAGTVIGVVDTVARGTAHIAMSGLHRLATLDEPRAGAGRAGADYAPATDDDLDVGGSQAATDLPIEPRPPEEPPIDVVGQALAAEAALGDREIPEGAGFAHEPRGASRDEEHGDAPLQRAEAEVIEDEVTAALEGDVEPEEPAEHLTEPLIDPATATALATEMETSSRAADPDKG